MIAPDAILPTEPRPLTMLPPPTSAAIAAQAGKLVGALSLFIDAPHRVDRRTIAREEALVLAALLEDARHAGDESTAFGVAAMLRTRREQPHLLATALGWARDVAERAADEARATEPPGGA